MPNIRKTVATLRRNLKHSLNNFLDVDTTAAAIHLADYTLKKTKLTNHVVFIGRSLRQRLIPKGFHVCFHPGDGDCQNKCLSKITNSCSRRLMQATIHNLKVKLNNISTLKSRACSGLQERCTEAQHHRVSTLISEMNSWFYLEIKAIKDAKFATLLNMAPSTQSTINQPSIQHKRTVVTIPDDLPLTDAENSVLSKGLTFVPVNSKTDEYKVKADCERYFRRLHLKAHFHDHEDASTTPENDPFIKFDTKTSIWTPPDGQQSAIDHYIDHCRRRINSRNYTRPINVSNLPQEEKQALQDLRHRSDNIIKPANKGGAVVVWSRELYNQEAHCQTTVSTYS